MNYCKNKLLPVLLTLSNLFNGTLLNGQPSLGFMFNQISECKKGELVVNSNWFRNVNIQYTPIDNLKLGLGFSYLFDDYQMGPFFNINYLFPLHQKHALIFFGGALIDITNNFSGLIKDNDNYYSYGSGYRYGDDDKNITLKLNYNSSTHLWYSNLFDLINPIFGIPDLSDVRYNTRSAEFSIGVQSILPLNKKGKWSFIFDGYYTRHDFKDGEHFNSWLPAAGFRMRQARFVLDLGLLYYKLIQSDNPKIIESASPVIRLEFLILKPKQKTPGSLN